MWTDAVPQLGLACLLSLIGWWGRRNAGALVRPGEDRAHRVTVLRRGALACQVVAALFAVATLPALF